MVASSFPSLCAAVVFSCQAPKRLDQIVDLIQTPVLRVQCFQNDATLSSQTQQQLFLIAQRIMVKRQYITQFFPGYAQVVQRERQ